MMPTSDDLALEFVLGTLRGQERKQFVNRLEKESELQDQVKFWEEQMMSFHHTTPTLEPVDKIWQNIEANIGSPSSAPKEHWYSFFANSWQWFASSALTLVVCLGLWFGIASKPPDAPTSYMAVMTSDDGTAVLTALAPQGEKSLWLQWASDITQKPGSDLQLWALSRSDNQARSLAVFDKAGINQLKIGKPEWGLIKDAEYLILTEEQPGGSHNQPSNLILAKGLCIQFVPGQTQG